MRRRVKQRRDIEETGAEVEFQRGALNVEQAVRIGKRHGEPGG